MDPWADTLVGRTLGGRYLLESLIGQGGMGAVFRASHVHIGTTVAVKVMHPKYLEDPEFLERFAREARSAGMLRDRGVARVLDFDTAPDVGPFLVMDFLVGEGLDARLKRLGRLSSAASAHLAPSILRTLVRVHAHGIVHRDLKPANIFLVATNDGGEETRILDFGIAQMVRPNRRTALTAPGKAMGSPRYMAPEQAHDAGGVDVRADVYSVGAILYRALSGIQPYGKLHRAALYEALLLGTPRPLRELAPELPEPLIHTVDRAMAHERTARFESAEAMLAALSSIYPTEDPTASTAPSALVPMSGVPAQAGATTHAGSGHTSPPAWRAHWPVWIVLAAVVILFGGIVASGVGLWAYSRTRSSSAPPSTTFDPLAYLPKANARAREIEPHAELVVVLITGVQPDTNAVDLGRMSSWGQSFVAYGYRSSTPPRSFNLLFMEDSEKVTEVGTAYEYHTPIPAPQCTIEEVLNRAKAKGIDPNKVPSLSLVGNAGKPMWSVHDGHKYEFIPDDCR